MGLNTPHRPYEASRTSGMKTALNGVPSWSVTDGWWREGQVEGAKGWDIGDEEIPDSPEEEIASITNSKALSCPSFMAGRTPTPRSCDCRCP